MNRYENLNRQRQIWKNGFYITMTILAVTNIGFFIYNWSDMYLDISQEGILLSVVGFFFAFAGINIYSIFNTNIEAEKGRLLDLADKYDGELKMSSQMLQFPQDIVMTYQTVQYLVGCNEMSYKSIEWMSEIEGRLTSLREFIQGLKDKSQMQHYDKYKRLLSEVATGISILLKQHQHYISYQNFFANMKSEEANYNNRLENLVSFVEDLRYYEYEDAENEDETPTVLTLKDKVASVWAFAKKTFCSETK